MDEAFVEQKLAELSGLAVNQHHYNATGAQQPIEVMQAFLPRDQFIGFLRGNVIKYTLRAGRKDDPAKEYEKAAQYAAWLVQAIRGETIDPRSGR